MLPVKYCTKCKTTLAVSKFQKLTSSKDGRHRWCSLCYNAYRRQRSYNSKYRPKDYEKVRRAWASNRKTVAGRASYLLRSARVRAINKDLDFDLSLDWAIENLEPMLCQATNVPLTFEIPNDQRTGRFSPSIDRKDFRLGYTQDNCHIVCMMYNQAKSQGTHEDVVAMAKALVNKENVSSV